MLHQDARLTLYGDDVLQPDGEPGTYTYLVLARPVAAIVPVFDDLTIPLVRQWRYPWDCNSWEIPAGHCEPGEDPRAAAHRELAEEVSLQAATMQHLATLHPSALVRADFHLFLARGLTPIRATTRDETEADLIVARVPLGEAVEAVLDNTIVHAVSALAILRVARALGV